MASIYLIRHTKPLVEKGTCYGQSDLDITDSFEAEAAVIRNCLPSAELQIYSSPLQRCRKLALRLFPNAEIRFENALMEIHCGDWEMKRWDDLPREDLDRWMNDYVQVRIPGGESYIDLFERVIRVYTELELKNENCAIVAHGGVIRSILSYITGTSLLESFSRFSLHYGCVIRLDKGIGKTNHTVLSNIVPEDREQHKPSAR